jgi:NADH-quinone oxidoreductase subunit J
MSLSFLILAVLTLAGAVAAMTLRRLVHCALALTVALTGLAALYLNLGAQFVGLAQILVYVGAVAILIVFAILLTRSAEVRSQLTLSSSLITGGVVSAAVFAVLAWAVIHSSSLHSVSGAAPVVTMKQIGDALMERYVLPLEVIGLMLTAALIGAAILALQEKPDTQ